MKSLSKSLGAQSLAATAEELAALALRRSGGGLGTTGATGASGGPGATGVGTVGATGVETTGATGVQGNAGATGVGTVGATGVGTTGATGASGLPGPAGSTAGVVVYQPGGVASGNVFTSFAALCAYTATFPTVEKWQIQIDGSFMAGSPVITTGVYAVPSNVEFVGVADPSNGGAYPTLAFASDVVFTPPPAELTFTNLPYIELANLVSPLVTVTGMLSLYVTGCELFGFGTFFAATAGAFIAVRLHNFATIDASTFTIDATSAISIGAFDQSSIAAGAATITAGGSLRIHVASSAVTLDDSYYTLAGVTVGIPKGVVASGTFATPNGVVTASPGALFSTSNGGAGTTFWVKESGVSTNTGWTPSPSPAAPGETLSIRFPVGLSTVSSVTSIPVGYIITSVTLNVTGVYTGGTTISIGSAGSPSLLMGVADNDPTFVSIYSVSLDTPWPLTAPIQATIAGAIAGSANVLVEYTIPNP